MSTRPELADRAAAVIRPITEPDWPQVWPIIREVVRAADTFPYDPAMSEATARQIWLEQPPGLTVVAVDTTLRAPDPLDTTLRASEPVDTTRPPEPLDTTLRASEPVVATAKMGPNRAGPGSHVATASFMVDAGHRGQGIGAALGRFVIDWARAEGYAGIQFNAVVESNTGAVTVYRRLGFEVIGTVPRAFAHPTLGRVGLHVMYLEF